MGPQGVQVLRASGKEERRRTPSPVEMGLFDHSSGVISFEREVLVK